MFCSKFLFPLISVVNNQCQTIIFSFKSIQKAVSSFIFLNMDYSKILWALAGKHKFQSDKHKGRYFMYKNPITYVELGAANLA